MVHHLPPGTSKWNKIEHRLFSFISMNWRAKPLVSYRVIVDLITATTTETGLSVRCELDPTPYATGVSFQTPRWQQSTSSVTPSMANGTTPSSPKHSLPQIEQLFPDRPFPPPALPGLNG